MTSEVRRIAQLTSRAEQFFWELIARIEFRYPLRVTINKIKFSFHITSCNRVTTLTTTAGLSAKTETEGRLLGSSLQKQRPAHSNL